MDQGILLHTLHLRKIDISDAILVLNVGGYVGESTKHGIAYAESIAKHVMYLEAPPMAGDVHQLNNGYFCVHDA